MADAGGPEPLVCPTCALTYPLHERFCAKCGMPLVYGGSAGAGRPVSERQERARKVKPQYAEGNPVRVARARNQAEAEFIQGLLLEEGVPSMLRRSAGFDVPDFLAAGPRDVLAPASGAEVARDVLLQAQLISTDQPARPAPARLLAGVVAGVLLVGALVWVLFDVLAR
jgi:hypothetical protein